VWNCSDVPASCDEVARVTSCCEIVEGIPLQVMSEKAWCPYIDAVIDAFGQQAYDAASAAVEEMCDISDVNTLCAVPIRTYVDNLRTTVADANCCGTTIPDVCAGTYEAFLADAAVAPTVPLAEGATAAPTTTPTDSPTGTPTTAEPTAAPSLAPSLSPSQAPTIATEDVRAAPFPSRAVVRVMSCDGPRPTSDMCALPSGWSGVRERSLTSVMKAGLSQCRLPKTIPSTRGQKAVGN
jgi:hypothetical protein